MMKQGGEGREGLCGQHPPSAAEGCAWESSLYNIKVPTAASCLWVERRISAPLSHCNHSHHYQKSQMVNSEDGVFVVGTLILMGNGLTASYSFLVEHQRAFRPK